MNLQFSGSIDRQKAEEKKYLSTQNFTVKEKPSDIIAVKVDKFVLFQCANMTHMCHVISVA